MTDHFATLGLPRQPWLEDAAVKEAFQRLSARHHPDATGGSEQAFSELNTAWQTLRDPAPCLRHWLELTSPETLQTPASPSELGDLFMEVASAIQSAERLRTKRTAATTPLARALLEPERISARQSLESAREKLTSAQDNILSELRTGSADAAQLGLLHHRLVFLGKWSAQVREALMTIAG